MEPAPYGPPEKVQIIRDLIPCRTVITSSKATFQYSTIELRKQAEALILLMSIPIHETGEYLSVKWPHYIEIKMEYLHDPEPT